MRPRLGLVLFPLLSLLLSGCDERANAGTDIPPAVRAQSGPDGGGPAPTVSARAAPTASSAADKPPVQVLKLAFTTEVKNKEPVDKLDHAEPGQRVWVHLTLRNRADEVRPLTVTFRVNDDPRSKVDLKVESSWSYRTWAYNTLRAGDVSGELAVDVRDEAGSILASARLPIKKP